MTAYRQCLEQNGVTLPKHHGGMHATGSSTSAAAPASGTAQPGGMHHRMGPPAGVSEQAWQKAQAACASIKPAHHAH
ncbi:hypothetical protein GCM10023147_48280 [Tsukamurella soli]|uniref:Uncharacterized protein n=2 Tax=Tsukamurella soli TaxID=644556 RepID=A0ABP8KED5_9ACTN